MPTEPVHLRKVVGKSQSASICSSFLAVFGKVCQERISCFADKKKGIKISEIGYLTCLKLLPEDK